jgi:murein DD-endopeptidase MepM/ murein hydrolase activator NlpD
LATAHCSAALNRPMSLRSLDHSFGMLWLIIALALAGCGTAATTSNAPKAGVSGAAIPDPRPQVVEPTAGGQPQSFAPSDPVGDVNAHAPPLSEVKRELRLELVAARVTNAAYLNPLRYVTRWERTDQGVDAAMPVGAPILAPGPVKVLAIEPGWYAGQPLVYFELLAGPDAGKVQYVAEQITNIASPGSYLQQGQVIAQYARSGTGIEYGWSTPNGITLARATTGYEEGQITPAGRSIRAWLNALGANAGPSI